MNFDSVPEIIYPLEELAMRKRRGHSIIELGVSAFLLVLLAFLCANVYVLNLAKSYNDRVCKSSILLAAKAALDGKDTQQVQQAARAGMDGCGMGGFFVGHPIFTEFKDEIVPSYRELKIQTKIRVLIPIPFLVLDQKVRNAPQLVFTSTYYYKINNPKAPST
jgi:hypothetical protein